MMHHSDVVSDTPKKAEMHRWFVALVFVIAAIAATAIAPAPRACAEDAPIGRLGDVLRVNADDPKLGRVVADVTVHDVVPAEMPPGWQFNGSPRWRFQGKPWRSWVTVHVIEAPTPYSASLALTFDAVSAVGADAYISKHTDDPAALETALINAPAGATVAGNVYYDVYRDVITHVLALNKTTKYHLAQWNL